MAGFQNWVKKIFGIAKSCPQEEECLKLARIMLDEESTQEEKDFVEKHIGVCAPCFENYEIELAIREVVKNKSEHKEVPENLVNEILDRIGQD